MNILFLSSVYPKPNDTTRGIYNYYLCRELARHHDVRVVSPWAWWSKLAWTLRGRRHSALLPHDGIKVDCPTYYYAPRMFYQQLADVMWRCARPAVRRAYNGTPVDVVLSYWAYPDGGAALHAAREYGAPCVLQVGGSDALIELSKPHRRDAFLRVFQGADLIIAVSNDIRRRLLAAGLPERVVRVNPMGVDLERFSPGDKKAARDALGLPQDRPLAIFVGNLLNVKGLDTLLAACERLQSRRYEFLQVIIGRGPLESWLRREITNRNLGNCVRLRGAVPHTQLPDWYRAADVTVLPSRSEGTPNVLMESIACGTPFVASRVGGIPDLATEPMDRLVVVDDPQDLAEAIAAILTSPTPVADRRFIPCSWEQAARQILGDVAPLVSGVSVQGS